MLTLEVITKFLGWCSIINIGLLLLSTLALAFMPERMISIHGKWFKLSHQELLRIYFQYLALFKLSVIMLNIVPYLALKMML